MNVSLRSLKSYVAYRVAPTQMTLSDLESHSCCLKHLYLPHLGKIAHIIYDMSVLGGHVHGKSGNISDTLEDRDVVTADR